MEENSVLDVGMGVIVRMFMALMGVTFAPVLLAVWELYALLFLYLGIPALLMRAVFPGTTPWINRAFNKSYEWVKRFSKGFLMLFIFREIL